MRKVLISVIVMLLSAPCVMAQYAPAEAGDVAMSQSFKTAKAIYNGGMITAWYGYSRMKKIRNSSGQTVATVNYGLGGNGLAFTMNF